MSQSTPPTPDLTDLVRQAGHGDKEALDRLLPLVYDELRALASRYMRKERAEHTMQTTALVHEAYLKLVDKKRARWEDKAHFMAIAASSIRRILVDYARRQDAEKRGRGMQRHSLESIDDILVEAPEQILVIDEALERLAAFDRRKARVVVLRFYGGLEMDEVAEVVGASPATVARDWSAARAWLLSEIGE